MLRLEALEVIQRFRKPGGDEFADFCNKIFLATCRADGNPESEIFVSTRTDAKDTRTDARVNSAVLTDKTGGFDQRSTWRYKTTAQTGISEASVKEEVNKDQSKRSLG